MIEWKNIKDELPNLDDMVLVTDGVNPPWVDEVSSYWLAIANDEEYSFMTHYQFTHWAYYNLPEDQ